MKASLEVVEVNGLWAIQWGGHAHRYVTLREQPTFFPSRAVAEKALEKAERWYV